MTYIAKWHRTQSRYTRLPLSLAAIGAVLLLGGCSGTEALYRQITGGPAPPPPPGLNEPYPNLASVPPKPKALSESTQATVRSGLETANQAQNALGGAKPQAPKPPRPAASPAPVLVAFPAHSAILPYDQKAALRALVARRGNRRILAAGFAPATDSAAGQSAGLKLALMRANAIANVLTEAGVPQNAIRLDALIGDQGGAALVLEKPHARATHGAKKPSREGGADGAHDGGAQHSN